MSSNQMKIEMFGMSTNMSDRLRHTLRLNDTEGYFVIGGGNFVKGAKGFFGPVVYHRNRIPPHREVTLNSC